MNAGQSYTMSFVTTTRMGIDTGHFTQRLIWQVHDYGCGNSPLTVLGIQNFTGTQTWYAQSGGNNTVTMPYTDGVTDTWKITVVPSTTGTGSFKLWRNGVQLANWPNIPTFVCGAKPFFNQGPYMWNWAGQGSGVSSLSQVGITFQSFVLTTP